MQQPQGSTTALTAANELRSIRVHGLLPMMDEIYIYNCFHDNAEVLAATVLRNWQTGWPLEYGFVEFATHSDAAFVLESYNGERYCLSWDTDQSGTRWRWDYTYESCSYFGYDKLGNQMDATKTLIAHYKNSIPPQYANMYRGGYHHQLQTQWPIQKTVSSLEKEKELYLCFEEVSSPRNCYVFRTIKHSELLLCSCDFSLESYTITKCVNCAPNAKQESQLRPRAWLYEGGKEERIPKYMSCCAYGSRMILAGGLVQPLDTEPQGKCVVSGDVYSFEAEFTICQKLDWSCPRVLQDPLLFEVNGNLYCFAASNPQSFKEHYSSSSGFFVLPDPIVNWQGQKEKWRRLATHDSFKLLACAVVGSKILISSMRKSQMTPFPPVICFDVNDKEKGWRPMTSLFDGKPFPFVGRALVLDVNGTHVMFSFRESYIYVSRLELNDDGDISISDDNLVGCSTSILSLVSF